MVTPKAIVDNLITILKAGTDLDGVKEWYIGMPPRSRINSYPYGWVEWAGGPKSPPVGDKCEINDRFYVVVVDRYPDEEVAEQSIMVLVQTLEAALAVDKTLAGSVARSYVTNREKDKQPQGDYSLAGTRITLSTHRRE